MSSKREIREHKEINTRKYKQQIENLKLDLMENQIELNAYRENMHKTLILLEKSVNFTKGSLKYDSKTLVELLNNLYKFNQKEE